MQNPISAILLVLVFHIGASQDVDTENSTQIETTVGILQTDVSTLEEALAALNQLTASQKKFWEQQEAHREQIRSSFSQFSQKEEERFRALKAEQDLFRGVRDQISRKLKVLAKESKTRNGNCNCNSYSITDIPPKDCAAIYQGGDDTSGVYNVWPTWTENGKGFSVYCDMETDGGGWTVIHRWEKYSGIPKDYFRRSWSEYSVGFGDLTSSFWIGTQKMYELTNQDSYELRFDFPGEEAVYSSFRVGDRESRYTAYLGEFLTSGTEDDVFGLSNKAHFAHESEICGDGQGRRSAWWFYSGCDISSKLYVRKTSFSFGRKSTSIEMKIRPVQFNQVEEV